MAQTTRPPRKPVAREPLPAQEISREVLLEKYAKDGEKTVAEVEPHIPVDTGKGRWKNATIPLKIPGANAS